MSLIPIVCANCGAKYRLPETFKSDHAKCKKCGAVIDVAGQRDVAPEPAAEAAAPAAGPGPWPTAPSIDWTTSVDPPSRGC